MRMFALRGAISVDADQPDAIVAATTELILELVERNDLEPERVVSAIFTATEDLKAEFPAVAARQLGWDRVPLLCAREIDVPGSLPRIIRVLLHYYAEEGHVSRHVYLRDARALRQDIEAAQ